MNWGNRIVVVFGGFALLIGTLVYKAMHTKFELVSKDYYADELRYQQKIDGHNNAAAAGAVQLQVKEGGLVLTMPVSLQRENIDAEAWFYCKSDASHDKKFHIRIGEGMFIFDTRSFARDQYELRLEFALRGKQFYYTVPVTIR